MSTPATRVLVVDDDPGIRLFLHDLLERMGNIVVAEAVDGPDGLRAAQDFHPDLMLLDLMMPGMTGIEVCRRLRSEETTRDIPVIVLSAASDSEHMLAAIDAGAEDFLPKPVSSPELRAKVRTLGRLNRVRTLAAERRRLQWLLDRAVEAMIVLGPDGDLRYANARARDLLGLGETLSGPVVAAVAARFQADPPSVWNQLTAGGAADGLRFTLHRPEHGEIPPLWLEAEVCIPAESVDGSVLLRVADVTAQIRGQLETWTFQRLISHKLSTPLNGLGPVLDFLEQTEAFSGNAETEELLHAARESADRLQVTIASILRHAAAAMPPAGTVATPRRETLARLLGSAAATARFGGPIRWIAGADETVAGAEVYELVLTELVLNYLKFSEAPRTGIVAEFIRSPAGRGSLRLCAAGPDLPSEAIARLGQPYVQIERTFTGEVPGMGLGLATCRQLLRWHGGDLRFGSAADWTGSGLAVWIDLPEKETA